MISLKFTLQELVEFRRFLVEVIKNLKNTLDWGSKPTERLKVKSELSELNKCYSIVNKKVEDSYLFSKIRKSYSVRISYMQGYLIILNNENFDLGPYASAILNERVTYIHKTLI